MAYIDEKENQDINAYAGMPARQKPVLGPPAAIAPRPSQFTPAVAAPTAQGPAARSQSNGPISKLNAMVGYTPGGFMAQQGGRMLTAAAVPFAPIVDLARNTANRLAGLDPNTAEGGASKYTDVAGDAFRREINSPVNPLVQGLVSSVTGARPQATAPTGRPAPVGRIGQPAGGAGAVATPVSTAASNPVAQPDMMDNVPPGAIGISSAKGSRLYSPDAISQLANRNVMPSTYEADKEKLRGYFMRYLASGDLEGARRTAMTPEDQVMLGAAEAQFQDARAGGPAPNYIQAIQAGQGIMTGLQKQQAGGIEMQGKITELAQKRQFNELYSKYLGSTDPAERARLQESILALTGKDKPEEWAALHAAGGNDPNNPMIKLPDSIVAMNKRTGQARVLAGETQAPYPEGTKMKGKDGKIYVVKNGVPVLQ